MSGEEAARDPAGAAGAQPGEARSGQEIDRREERFRQATIAAGAPMLLLFAPFLLPLEGGRSLYDELHRETLALAVMALGLGLPLALGAVSLWLGARRRAPGKVAFAVPAALQILVTGGASVILAVLLAQQRRAREEVLVWLCLLVGAFALYLLVRGFFRRGFERWAQLIAGVALFQAEGALLVAIGEARWLALPELGAWLFLFALGVLGPVIAWMLWPRRA